MEALPVPRARVARLPAAVRSPLWLVAPIAGLAAALRLYEIALTPTSPYYDAAVRSMGLSWHNFFFAAYEPGATVAIDKPPLDLWLQVASTKLFGFGPVGLLLPQALAGTATVVLVYDLVRRPFGRLGGLVAAAVAAVLPISVVTSRSDTMDSVMAALMVLALWLVVRAAERGRPRLLYAAALAAGLAFEVKLLEALIVVPALVVLYAVAAQEPLRKRVRHLLLAGAVYLVAALWWPLAVTIAPGPKPDPLGSTNGSYLNSTFVFNGTDRLLPANAATSGGTPGPLRLLQGRYVEYVGGALVLAAVLAALAVAMSVGRPGRRLRHGLGWSVAAWVIPAFVVFSGMHALHLRYLEALGPAVALAIGAAIGALTRGRSRTALVAGLALAAVWFVPTLARSTDLVRLHATDSGHVGYMSPSATDRIAAYLGPRTRGVRYEAVSATYPKAAPLIVHDGRPVLIAMGVSGRTLLSPQRLSREVAAGRLRYALFASGCGKAKPSHVRRCPAPERWLRRHGTDVSRRAGLQVGTLFRLTGF